MGIYLNPSSANLQKDLNSQIYIDKSMLISELNKLVNTNRQYVCVSRARRFGKSMAGNMIAAYYCKDCDSRQLFAQLRISQDASYERFLNKFNVIKFDLNGLFDDYPNDKRFVNKVVCKIVSEFRKQYPNLTFPSGCTLVDAILEVYTATMEQFVIIIDEYDVLVRDPRAANVLPDYLRLLSSLFKNADLSPAIALAYLTGILPIVRDKVQSKLNMFEEYTMLDSGRLAPYFGFTADEARQLCEEYDMDYEECCRWYDGYDFLHVGEVFNPKSLAQAMERGACGNYWARSGSYESILPYIMMDFDGVRESVIPWIRFAPRTMCLHICCI